MSVCEADEVRECTLEREKGTPPLLDREAMLARYRRNREVARSMHAPLLDRLGIDALKACASKLGILRKGVFVFDSESEIALLTDYALFCHRTMGKNAIERYLAEAPYAPGSDELAVLEAKAASRYSLFVAQAIQRGLGAEVKDVVRGDRLFVVDVSFSETLEEGHAFATRLLVFPEFAMTTGAALPIFRDYLPAIGREVIRRFGRERANQLERLSASEQGALQTVVLTTCLRLGASHYVRYDDPQLGLAP